MKLRLLPLLVSIGGAVAIPGYAQSDDDRYVEEVITTGTRIQGRSAVDSVAPIDVISGEDFVNQGDTDLTNLLRNVVPSYNVNTQPISDAATIVRPANLRGLPPDSTLLLLNGKRRHRAAVISFLGGGLSDGAQGADISAIPAIALRQVEVLRDGAAAQYGSDAIAGVINLKLKDADEGFAFESKWGSTYEGDGDQLMLAANLGMPFSDDGFANVSVEYRQADATSRSVQRDDAQSLIDAGNTEVGDPAQIWGSPEIEDDFKAVINLGLDLGGGREFYAFGNYNERTTDGGFFFRNPDTRSGVFSNDDGVTRLVGDLDTTNDIFCPGQNGVAPLAVGDAAGLAAVLDNSTPFGADCFVFNELFPGGFTPRFGGDLNDVAGVMGVRGDTDNGLSYDVSIGAGRNQVDFFIYNTINATLGPQTPTSFDPGTYVQLERNFNIDLAYPIELDTTVLNLAGGFEWREEQFEARVGDNASFEVGPLTDQGFSVGSNGFPGFGPQVAGEFARENIAFYFDTEAVLMDSLVLGAALRWEDFEDFGDTTNGKLSIRWDIIDEFALRATAATGFRAPTPGQSNITNVTTAFTGGVLINRGTIPPTNPIAQLKGGRQLEPEESQSYSVGTVFSIGEVDVTLDYFFIELEDRITQSADQELTDDERQALVEDGITGAESLDIFRFYTNDFDTETQGVDLVATYGFDFLGGSSDLSLAFNWTETEVTSFNPATLDDTRIRQLEENLPEYRGNITWSHLEGPWRGLLRLNYFGEYYEAHLDDSTLPIEAGDEFTVDIELAHTFADKYTVVVGAENVLDEYPDDNPWAGVAGAEYPVTSPMGFNGGFYYLRFRYEI